MAKTKRETYTQVYSDYYPYIYNTVYGKTNNEDDTHDICQEIFIILYEKFETVENHRKWLFGTMRNVIFRYYEKKSKTPVDIDNVFGDISLTYVNGFKDTRIIIEEAIAEVDLTEEETLILDYIAFNNYSYNKTAEAIGLTKRQVGYKYLGAVKKILSNLESKGVKNIEDLL